VPTFHPMEPLGESFPEVLDAARAGSGWAFEQLFRSLAVPAAGYLRAEAAYAVTHEGARRLEDVFARRTRIAIETADGGLAAAAEVAELLRRSLGWSAQRASDEVAAYRGWVTAERAAQRDPGLCQPAGTSVTLFT